MPNPFLNEQGVGATDATSRIAAIERFDEQQLLSALAVPQLQKTVARKVIAKLRKLEAKKVQNDG